MKYIIVVGVILTVLIDNVRSNNLANTKLHTIFLDHHEIKLSWLVDWHKKEVMFNVDNAFSKHHKWFSFGFSKRGNSEQSDLCYFIRESNDIFDSVDIYVNMEKQMFKDYQQDCKILRIDDRSVAFQRKFDTCDPQDLRMHEGTMYILWARGNETIEFTSELPLSDNNKSVAAAVSTNPHAHGNSSAMASSKDQGMVMVQLLRADKLNIPEKNLTEIIIRLNKVQIPKKETTYWCFIHKLDDLLRQKHHIVQFEPIITTESIVHHMEIFHCDTHVDVEIPLYNGDCDQLPEPAKVCSRVMTLWAMGASTFTYPKEAGLPIGGADYNPFVRLEVHFNNPDKLDGISDSSGMKIKVISELRKHDAGIMELGLEYTDKMAIPPGIVAFPLSGYCIAECTNIALPSSGITIFGSQLHTHLRGVRILTRHFRDGVEMREINRDDYYSHHFQEIRYLRYKPKVLPVKFNFICNLNHIGGDALITTCYYDTKENANITLGGFSISDEMCVNYIQYYPATKLEVCKSSVSEQTLSDYFNYMLKKEHQVTINPKSGARSENYRVINWSEPRVNELYTMYVQEPLSMQCNRSDGLRFANYEWESAPITLADVQVPIHRDTCKKYNPFGVIPLEQGRCGFLGECIY